MAGIEERARKKQESRVRMIDGQLCTVTKGGKNEKVAEMVYEKMGAEIFPKLMENIKSTDLRDLGILTSIWKRNSYLTESNM